MNLFINIENKKFGTKKILNSVNINLNQNGIYGIYGKNGSGKTTFFNCLLNLTDFQGEITIDNEKLNTNQIAYIPTEPILYEYLTSEEFMKFFSLKVLNQKFEPNNLTFPISKNILIKNQSTGMKKKTYINSVLQTNDYKLFIFDEPFNGLDIESNYILLEKIKKLAENNIIFVSSHILEIISPFTKANFVINNQEITEENIENIKNILLNEATI